MAKKKKNKIGLNTLILIAVAVVGIVLAIIGIANEAFTSMKISGNIGSIGGSTTTNVTLKNIAESDADMAGLFSTFAYVVMIAAIVCAALQAVKVFFNNDLITKGTGLVGVLAFILTVLFIVFGIIYCSKNSSSTGNSSVGGAVDVSFAIGAWLTLIGGLLASISTVLSAKK